MSDRIEEIEMWVEGTLIYATVSVLPSADESYFVEWVFPETDVPGFNGMSVPARNSIVPPDPVLVVSTSSHRLSQNAKSLDGAEQAIFRLRRGGADGPVIERVDATEKIATTLRQEYDGPEVEWAGSVYGHPRPENYDGPRRPDHSGIIGAPGDSENNDFGVEDSGQPSPEEQSSPTSSDGVGVGGLALVAGLAAAAYLALRA